MSADKENIEKKKVLRIYAAFGAALILSLVPTVFAAVLSLFLGIGVLVAAYVMRRSTPKGGLIENHMTFTIRTIWIGSFLGFITTALGSVYLFFNLDNEPLMPCFSDMMAAAQKLNAFGDIESLLGRCFEPYWFLNAKTFIAAGIMIAAPVLIYFVARYARGLSRALNGYRVAKPLAWF